MMQGAYADVTQAIGDTPIVRLNRLAAGLKADIYVKLAYMNPGGSSKDVIGLNMIEQAEKRGELKPGGTIVEATGGTTGMGLAMAAATRGYRCIFVMTDRQSMAKVKALRATGAKVIITPADVEPEDTRSWSAVARRIVDETPGAFYADQYHNPDNPGAHSTRTGPEIWRQTGGEMHAFVAGLGTGGTITGAGRYFKAQDPAVQLVGVDVEGSVYYDFWKTGRVVEPRSYKVEGIGAHFLPSTLDLSIVDEMIQLSDKACFTTTRALARQEGIYTGGSGGAAVAGAIRYAEMIDRPANIVVLLPDSAGRYLETVFDDEWMREHGFLDPEDGLGTIRDLLGNKHPEVYTVGRQAKVHEVIRLMKDRGISQVPVLDSGHLLGVVNESALLQLMLEKGADGLEAPINSAISEAYEVADPDAPVGLFNHIFNQGKVIVVWERGEVRGLVTKIDVIDFLAHRRAMPEERGT